MPGCCHEVSLLRQHAQDKGYSRLDDEAGGDGCVMHAEWVCRELAAVYRAESAPSSVVESTGGSHAGKRGSITVSDDASGELSKRLALAAGEQPEPERTYRIRSHRRGSISEVVGTQLRVVPTPSCAHCAWFDPWQANVLR